MNQHRGRMKRYFLILLPVLLLAGCSSLGSTFESKKIDYKSASKLSTAALEVPPDLTTPSASDRYAVPNANKGSTTFSSYAGERAGEVKGAGGAGVLPQVDKMRVERSGTQRWLVIAGSSPEKLWPAIKDFWQETGFIINSESLQTGIMETDWAENRAKLPQDVIRSTLGKVFDGLYSTSERDKFRTRLEKGSEAGSTEIYISHRGMYEVYTSEGKSDTRWQPRQPDPELEAEMLRRLMVRLGAGEAQAQTLVAAQPSSERAKLIGDGKGSLRLEEPFDRAWRRVGLALDRVGFTVEDRDRSQGVYFVRYVDPESDVAKKQSKGFLDKLMFWKSGKSDSLKTAQFRIHVKAQGETSTVTVLTAEGGLDQSETSGKILGLLLNQLK